MIIKKVCVVISVLLLVALLAASLGLGCDGGGGLSPTAVAKMLPKKTDSFEYLNVQKLRADRDLDELYDEWRDDYEYSDVEYETGVRHSEVTYWIEADCPEDYLYILGGKFDLEEIRDELEDNYYEEDEYRGVEVWDDGYTSVAFPKGRVVTGYIEEVEDCIEAIQGGRSLYDDSDVSQIVRRLSSGLAFDVEADPWEQHEGLVAEGVSYAKKDSRHIKGQMVYLFEDEDAAEDALDEIVDDLPRDFHVSQSGRTVVITGEGDISDLD